MNSYDRKYLDMVRDVLENGTKKMDRTGVGTYSVFGRQLRHDMSEGFPLLTTKKIFTKAMFHELLWFISGGDNIRYLVQNGVRIWNEWPYERYIKHEEAEVELMREQGVLVDYQKTNMDEFVRQIIEDREFAERWGALGPVYGYQWRKWEVRDEQGNLSRVDQLQAVIDDLRDNPDSRRIMVTAWNPGQLKDQLLPPCHFQFQLWTKELTSNERESLYHNSGRPVKLVAHFKHPASDVQADKLANAHIHEFLDDEGVPRRSLSLMFNMRSVDCFLGAPFDIASYGALLHMLAHFAGMTAGDLIMTSGDTHVYQNHIDQVKEQLSRQPYKLPKFELKTRANTIDGVTYEELSSSLTDYQCHPAIKAEVAV